MLRIPYTLGGFLAGFAASPMLLVILLNLFIFVLGFFMPAMVIINIFTPIVVPVLTKMGVDPIFFGVVMVLNTMIGMLTPPYGIVLFTLSKVSDVPLRDVIREMWPFIFALAVVVALLLAFPPLVTFIPSMLK
jgi:TRAP-type C4-dicarboxylate transport system permease large subunit